MEVTQQQRVQKYSGAVTIGENLTLKAIAVKSGMSNSPITSGAYTILLPTTAPQFSPAAGTFTASQSVTITSATPGASYYYTTNGTEPTTSSTLYTGPVSIAATTTLKAITVKSRMSTSSVTSGEFVILGPASAPTFSLTPGTYIGSQTVSLSTTSSGAKIRYTTDGTTPSETVGTEYNGPITVGVNTTINAIAFGAAYAQ